MKYSSQNSNYKKASLQNFASQVNVACISNIDDLVVSYADPNDKIKCVSFNFPYVMQGILLIFCVKGEAMINVNLREYCVVQNSLLVITPNNFFSISSQSIDFKIEFLFYTFDFISNIKLTKEFGETGKIIEAAPLLFFETKIFEDLLLTHKLIVNQCLSSNPYKENAIKAFIQAISFQILQFYSKNHSNNQESKKINRSEVIFQKFISLVFEHYKKERSIQFYAEKMNLTPKYFSKIIKQRNNVSAAERIDEVVIMSAKALLKSSDLTVAQISEELNFANPSFFGTYFKKRVGLSPMQYRLI